VEDNSLLGFLPKVLQSPETYTVVLAVILIVVAFAIIKRRNISISIWGKKILDVEEKDSDDKHDDDKSSPPSTVSLVSDSKTNRHYGCPHINDFILIITETTNITSEIAKIKYRTCLSEQMFKACQHLLRLRSIYQNTYRNKVSYGQDNAEEGLQAYKFYQALTRIIIQDLKDLIIRVAFLNNHLAQYTDDKDYDIYIEGQYQSIVDMMNDIVSDMYFGNWSVKQKEVLEMHENLNNELKKIVWDIYLDAREIAVRNDKLIEEYETKFKNFVKKIVGISD
jgi:hypothetical protein